MREDTRINIQCKEGQDKVVLLTGNDLIELQDESSSTFSAMDIPAFQSYLEGRDGDFVIFCNRDSLIASPREISVVSTNIAECCLSPSCQLGALRRINHQKQTPKAFQEFMKSMRRYYDKAGRDLEYRNDNLEVKDCVQAKRIRGRDGSMEIMVSRKNNDGERLVIPEKVVFAVPMYRYHPEAVEIEMEVTFDYEVTDGEFLATWKLDSYDFDDVLEDRFRAIIDGKFDGLGWERYWGNVHIHAQTDGWRFRKNPMSS